MPVQTKIQLRRDVASNWTSTNPTLAAGEIGVETDTNKFKVGNGTAWSLLGYAKAGTATTLETARNINGVSFNGSADITVTAAAGTLTGTTLNSTVVSSSLTSVGTITSGTWSGSFGAVSGANLTNLTAANLVGTISSSVVISGNAATATKLQTIRKINGVDFDGTADITVTTAAPSTLTIGTGLSGISYNGGAPVTIAIDSTVATLTGSQALSNKTLITAAGTLTVAPLKLTPGTNLTTATAGAVEFDGTNLYFTPSTTRKTIAFIDGNVATATALATSRNINGVAFNGSADVTVTAAAGTLTGTALNSTVVTSSLTTVGTVTAGTWSGLFGSVTGANLTNLTAANLTGTISSAVLGNSTVYIGSTAVALNRATGNLALTGISSITLPGGTSGTVQLLPSGISGSTVLTLPATTGTVALTSDLPVASSSTPLVDGTAAVGSSATYARADHVHPVDTSRAPVASPTFTGTATAPTIVASGLNAAGYVTNTAGGQLGTVATIPNAGLTNSTISGVALGNALNALTISSPLSGTSYNGSGAVSIGLSAAYGDTTNPYGSKTANFVLAAPNGAAGTPSFRALVAADIPSIAQSQVTNLTTDLSAKASLNGATLTNVGAITTAATTTLLNNPITITESSHATSRRASIQIGSSWEIGQNFDTATSNKDFYIFSGQNGFAPLTISVNGLVNVNGVTNYWLINGGDLSYGTLSSSSKPSMFPGLMTSGVALDVSSMYQFEIFAVIQYTTNVNGSNKTMSFSTRINTGTVAYSLLNCQTSYASTVGAVSVSPTSPPITGTQNYSNLYYYVGGNVENDLGTTGAGLSAGGSLGQSGTSLQKITGTILTSGTSGARFYPKIFVTSSGTTTATGTLLAGSYIKLSKVMSPVGSW